MNENIIRNLNAEYKILSDRKSKMYDDYLDHSITKEFYEEKLKE